jgi:NADH-quinone oxidoreductase subunit J
LNLELVVFLVLAVAAVASAILVITRKNPVASALYLVLNLFIIAVLYLFLRAQFIAIIQITVYAGAIMVLFLFVIMLLNLGDDKLLKWRLNSKRTIGLLIGFALLAEILFYVMNFVSVSGLSPKSESMGTVESIGKTLYGSYLFPFEITSILLLAAIVGSIFLSKKRSTEGPGGE